VMANQGKAQLPQCLIQNVSVGYDFWQIRVALFKKDTVMLLTAEHGIDLKYQSRRYR